MSMGCRPSPPQIYPNLSTFPQACRNQRPHDRLICRKGRLGIEASHQKWRTGSRYFLALGLSICPSGCPSQTRTSKHFMPPGPLKPQNPDPDPDRNSEKFLKTHSTVRIEIWKFRREPGGGYPDRNWDRPTSVDPTQSRFRIKICQGLD
jgi:hypothetical protein